MTNNNNQSNQLSVVTLFDNNANNRIRTINRKGNAWYVAADVLYILGFAVSKRGSILKDSPEIKLLNSSEKSTYTQTKRGGSVTKFTIISESGLYKLIMRSNKPAAKPFQDWVAGEVLLEIASTGKYDEADHKTNDDDEWDHNAGCTKKERREYLKKYYRAHGINLDIDDTGGNDIG